MQNADYCTSPRRNPDVGKPCDAPKAQGKKRNGRKDADTSTVSIGNALSKLFGTRFSRRGKSPQAPDCEEENGK